MQGENLTYWLTGALAIALVIAAFTDIRRRQIDNWLNAGIALAAPLFWWASGLDLIGAAMQLGVALVAFLILAGLFAMRMMGGGDVKLLTALALWLPLQPYLKLLVIMALVGGIVTIVFGSWHIMRRETDKLKVPYGIAIATAGLWIIATTYAPQQLFARIAGW